MGDPQNRSRNTKKKTTKTKKSRAEIAARRRALGWAIVGYVRAFRTRTGRRIVAKPGDPPFPIWRRFRRPEQLVLPFPPEAMAQATDGTLVAVPTVVTTQVATAVLPPAEAPSAPPEAKPASRRRPRPLTLRR